MQQWNALPSDELKAKLTAIGLYVNHPEAAITCVSCEYALKPAGETVSKHLWKKHKMTVRAREGLTAYVKQLHLPDIDKLPLRANGSAPHLH